MATNYFTRNKPELQEAQRIGMQQMRDAGYTYDEIAEEITAKNHTMIAAELLVMH